MHGVQLSCTPAEWKSKLMSVDPSAPFQVRDNLWQSNAKPSVASEGVDKGHRISGCTFEVKGAVYETAAAQTHKANS